MVPKPPLRQSSAGEIQKGLGKHGKIVDDISPLYQRAAQSARAGGRKMAGISRYEKAALRVQIVLVFTCHRFSPPTVRAILWALNAEQWDIDAFCPTLPH